MFDCTLRDRRLEPERLKSQFGGLHILVARWSDKRWRRNWAIHEPLAGAGEFEIVRRASANFEQTIVVETVVAGAEDEEIPRIVRAAVLAMNDVVNVEKAR